MPTSLTDDKMDKLNLEDVSTRNLLNELFKRGVIKKFEYTECVDDRMFDILRENSVSEQLKERIFKNAFLDLSHRIINSEFSHFTEKSDGNVSKKFTLDFFMVEHPVSVRKKYD